MNSDSSASERERLLAVCRDVIAPLVRADGGDVFLVAIDADGISLHLTGTCAGCPGLQITTVSVIEPVIRAIAPKMRVTISSGHQVPEGAKTI